MIPAQAASTVCDRNGAGQAGIEEATTSAASANLSAPGSRQRIHAASVSRCHDTAGWPGSAEPVRPPAACQALIGRVRVVNGLLRRHVSWAQGVGIQGTQHRLVLYPFDHPADVSRFRCLTTWRHVRWTMSTTFLDGPSDGSGPAGLRFFSMSVGGASTRPIPGLEPEVTGLSAEVQPSAGLPRGRLQTSCRRFSLFRGGFHAAFEVRSLFSWGRTLSLGTTAYCQGHRTRQRDGRLSNAIFMLNQKESRHEMAAADQT